MTAFFFLFALVTLLSAIGVVALRNPIHSALSLVLHLLMISALFAMLQAHFLATVQVIVYAGAIMVLVLFVLMLLNLKTEAPRPLNFIVAVFGVLSSIGLLMYIIPPLQSAFHIFPD